MVLREDIVRYARRPWAAREAEKRDFLARLHGEDPAAHFASMCALREHMRRVRPEWPTPEDLAADLADLVEWKRKIDRVALPLIDR